jgi:hypothetical protein
MGKEVVKLIVGQWLPSFTKGNDFNKGIERL